jgi:hypothetical protein
MTIETEVLKARMAALGEAARVADLYWPGRTGHAGPGSCTCAISISETIRALVEVAEIELEHLQTTPKRLRLDREEGAHAIDR